jgi:hypothetical protein
LFATGRLRGRPNATGRRMDRAGPLIKFLMEYVPSLIPASQKGASA